MENVVDYGHSNGCLDYNPLCLETQNLLLVDLGVVIRACWKNPSCAPQLEVVNFLGSDDLRNLKLGIAWEVSVVEGSQCYQSSNYPIECGILLLWDSTSIVLSNLRICCWMPWVSSFKVKQTFCLLCLLNSESQTKDTINISNKHWKSKKFSQAIINNPSHQKQTKFPKVQKSFISNKLQTKVKIFSKYPSNIQKILQTWLVKTLDILVSKFMSLRARFFIV